MKLYLYPPAPFSRKVLLATYERGISLDLTVVTPFDPVAKEAMRKIHPIVSLPLLVTDSGSVIPESSVIAEYLDLITPGDPLLDRDPLAALPMRSFDRYGDQLLT
ncbi:MAG: glutathione S-transferase family protein, partial [Polyangiaceae bacterium]